MMGRRITTDPAGADVIDIATARVLGQTPWFAPREQHSSLHLCLRLKDHQDQEVLLSPFAQPDESPGCAARCGRDQTANRHFRLIHLSDLTQESAYQCPINIPLPP